MAHQGWPLVGDPLYGRSGRKRQKDDGAYGLLAAFPRQALHAAELHFTHPVSGKKMSFKASLPADFSALLKALRKTLQKTG
jgi:23S rRNA pseudouridine1911/1915/1917 synthase